MVECMTLAMGHVALFGRENGELSALARYSESESGWRGRREGGKDDLGGESPDGGREHGGVAAATGVQLKRVSGVQSV